MFGRHPKLVIDAFHELPDNIEKPKDQSEYVRKLEDRLRHAYSCASESAEKVVSKRKVLYDVKAKAPALQPGDLVLARNVNILGRH